MSQRVRFVFSYKMKEFGSSSNFHIINFFYFRAFFYLLFRFAFSEFKFTRTDGARMAPAEHSSCRTDRRHHRRTL